MTKNLKQTAAETLRLNKLLAWYGLCSRRKADEWIRAGRIAIDGIICREVGVQVNPFQQRIAVDGKLLDNAPPRFYILINKPVGVLTTKSDPQNRKTVVSLLPNEYMDSGIFPVGRLDCDSEGLLLLTNDGDWGQILVHPRHQIWKEYKVTANKPLTPELKIFLEQGIEIEGKKTLPAKISKLGGAMKGSTTFTIAIREGRNRQIRNMCKAIGLKVVSLKRTKMGPIHLGKLKIGEWRQLQDHEVKAIFQLEKDLMGLDSTT